MPEVDTAYSIGVIREWEKGFLEDDEFTRLIEAPDAGEAVHTLADTPYGRWLDQDALALTALAAHLEDIHLWLKDVIGDSRVIQFISARYDALNIAGALLDKQMGQEAPGPLSKLGFIGTQVIQSTIWQDIGWEKMPEFWERTVREIVDLLDTTDRQNLVAQIASQETAWRRQLLFTPLMREIDALMQERQATDETRRPFKSVGNASHYEREWDERLLEKLRYYRLAPIGYDPIISFWYGKELEVKQLRLLIVGKFNGLSGDELRYHRRTLYRAL